MLFRSIFLAVAAFATVASAMPAPAPQIPGGGGLPGGGIVDDILDPFSLGSGSTTGGGSGGVVPPIPRGQYDPAGSLQKCHTGILSVVVKIGDACGDHSNVDHNIVIGLLKEILALLGTLLFELKGGDYHGCDVNVLAGLIGGILITLAEVLALVIGIVGTVDQVLCGVVAEIAALLCEILKLVFGLVDGLLAAVVVLLVSPFSDHCHEAGLSIVLVALGL